MGSSRWASAAALLLLLAASAAVASAAELRGNAAPAGAAAAVDCGTTAGLAAARAAVASWTRRHRHVKQKHLYHTWTRARLLSLHACVADRSGSTRERDVAVVVMGSAKKRDRLARQQESWGRRAEAAGARVTYVSDAPDAELRVTVLEDPAARDPSYDGAQHRSLRGLQHAVAAHPDARWYWLVDDDTFYDVAEAAAAVRFLDHRLPVAVGYVYRGLLRFGSEHRSSIYGGAGILLSAGAAHAMAAALYTPACPFSGVNDVTLSECAYNLDVPLVHHEGWAPDFDGFTAHDTHFLRDAGGGYVSLHRLVPGEYIADYADRLALLKPPAANATQQLVWKG